MLIAKHIRMPPLKSASAACLDAASSQRKKRPAARGEKIEML
jgi:hypothetical protein